MTTADPHYATLLEIARSLRRRAISPVELTQDLLRRIARLDPALHAYVTVTADLALAQAKAAETEIGQGQYRGPLHGVPIAVKDLCYTKGIPTAAGTVIHRGWKPGYDATVVRRLAAAGAVLLGKLQLTEGAFALHHPDVDPPRNPWNAQYWTGVSSSGSGVATAAGLCFGSLGSDTGGSIRFPSAANGIVGLKPTWGRVSRHGVFALADSLDHIGPMTRSVGDAAAMLGAIAGADPEDGTTLTAPVPDYLAEIDGGIRGVRIGIDRRYNGEGTDPEVLAAVDAAIAVLQGLGAEIQEVTVPSPQAVIQHWGELCGVETAIAHQATYPARAAEYGPALSGLIDLGRSVSGIDLMKIHHARLEFSGRLAGLFDEIDLLALPAQPVPPPTVAEVEASLAAPDGTATYLHYTAPFDMSGSPTLSLPAGFSRTGLPIGFQLAGRHLDEALLLRAGNAYEQATAWLQRHPPL
jgi:amidase